jgi:hypothetical protein
MIFVAIMVGARLDGMSGIICALPFACVINVLINHVSARIRPAKTELELSRASLPTVAVESVAGPLTAGSPADSVASASLSLSSAIQIGSPADLPVSE